METLVTTSLNPDLDGIASVLAYIHLLTATGEGGKAGFEGKFQLDAQFLLEQLAFSLPPMPNRFDKVVLINASTRADVPNIVKKHHKKVVEVIDHRLYQDIEFEFPSVKRVNVEQVGACATIIVEELARYSEVPPQTIATLLHAAIHSNTLDLKAGVTTQRDREAAALLASWYPMSRSLIDEMFRFRTILNPEQAESALKNDFKSPFNTADGILGIAQIEMLDGTALFLEHTELIYRVLKELKEQYNLDYVFLTIPCIDQKINHLYAVDKESADFLRKYMAGCLDTSPDSQSSSLFMKTSKLLLRKEIVPMFENLEL